MKADRLTLSLRAPPVINKGIPAAKGRARAVAKVVYRDGAPTAIVNLVTPEDTRKAERAIRAAFKRKYPRHTPWAGPIMLRFTAVFAIPTTFSRKLTERARRGDLVVTKKPDKDNIEKLIVDALNNVAFHDDSQIVGGGTKVYGAIPRIEFSLTRLEQPSTPAERAGERRRAAELPLGPGGAVKSKPDNAVSAPPPIPDRPAVQHPTGFNPYGGPSGGPDLTGHSPRAQALIRQALEREAREKARRGR